MSCNVGTTERLIRGLVIAPIAIVLALVVFGVDTVLGIVFLVVAAAMLGTALIRWCPLNRLFGIDTCGESKAGDARAGTAR